MAQLAYAQLEESYGKFRRGLGSWRWVSLKLPIGWLATFADQHLQGCDVRGYNVRARTSLALVPAVRAYPVEDHRALGGRGNHEALGLVAAHACDYREQIGCLHALCNHLEAEAVREVND